IQYTQFNLIIREVYEYSPSDEASLWERIVEGFTNNAQSFIRTLETGFIFIVTTLPFLLIQLILWCIPLIIVYFIYRKVSKKKFLPWFKQKMIKVEKQDDHKE
ncbi:MAG: DUF4349 domain-containing protein, partial [Erysipelotrichaceae bacterium]|nr:DUF4349 domain-containing protein [Erysipelotrichaceae bacterium]